MSKNRRVGPRDDGRSPGLVDVQKRASWLVDVLFGIFHGQFVWSAWAGRPTLTHGEHLYIGDGELEKGAIKLKQVQVSEQEEKKKSKGELRRAMVRTSYRGCYELRIVLGSTSCGGQPELAGWAPLPNDELHDTTDVGNPEQQIGGLY